MSGCSTRCQRGRCRCFGSGTHGQAGPGPIPPHLLSKRRSASTGSHVGTRGRVTRTPPRHTYASDQWTTRHMRVSRSPAHFRRGAQWRETSRSRGQLIGSQLHSDFKKKERYILFNVKEINCLQIATLNKTNPPNYRYHD